MMMDEFSINVEEEMKEAALSILNGDFDTEVLMGEVPSDTNQICGKWARPTVPPLNPSTDHLVFQQIDVDHYTGNPLPGMPGAKIGPVPVMRLYGVTSEGISVCCHVHGFTPYFFTSAPPKFTNRDCYDFQKALNKAIMADMKGNKDSVQEPVLAVEVVHKQTLYGYHGEDQQKFLKIYLALPSLIAPTKRLLGRGDIYPGDREHCYILFECNIDFNIRFMVDSKMVGSSWIELPAGTWTVRRPDSSLPIVSLCQLEVDVAWDKLISHQPEGEWSNVAPFRILSFDIECAGRKDIFPEANHDPVIQIANVVIRQGDALPFLKNIFTLDTCAPINGCQVISCETEEEMLCKWADFVRQVDPDMFAGYNNVDFDFPYLVNRAEHLKLEAFPFLGRIKNIQSVVKKTPFFSQRMRRRRENRSINTEGRVQLDLMLIIVRDYQLSSYTLNSVSQHFLNEQKEDVHFSCISDLQMGSPETRRRLAVYCLKDAYLPIQLLDKLTCVIKFMEITRVTGIPLASLLTTGRHIKFMSQLLRKARERDFIIPTYQSTEGDDAEDEAYYADLISTFNSNLPNPSIIVAHNLCYTTLLLGDAKDRLGLTPDQYSQTPSNHLFVKPSVRKGLLPEILENLLSAQKQAESDLKNEKDLFKRRMLECRQLALQISANSFLAFTAVQVGKIAMPCLEILRSSMAYSRTYRS